MYKIAGAQSMKDLQEFATDQDLTALDYFQRYDVGKKDRNEIFGKTVNIIAASNIENAK